MHPKGLAGKLCDGKGGQCGRMIEVPPERVETNHEIAGDVVVRVGGNKESKGGVREIVALDALRGEQLGALGKAGDIRHQGVAPRRVEGLALDGELHLQSPQIEVTS